MAAREIRAGKAFIEVSIRDGLKKGLLSAAKRLRRFSASVGLLGSSLLAGSGAVFAPLTAAVANFVSAGDKLDKMAARTRLSVEALSELGFAAEQSGTDLDQLGAAAFRFTRRVANAATETGPAVRALKELGLSAADLTQLSPEDQLFTVAAALSRVENEGRAAQLAFELFGDNARQIMPLLRSDIEGLREQARALGIVMSTEDATAAAKLGDAFNVLKRIVGSIKDSIGAALAPVLTELLEPISVLAVGVARWVKENQQLFVTLAKVAAGVAVAGGLLVALSAVGFTVAGIFAGIAGTMGLVGLAAGFVGSAIALLATKTALLIATTAAATGAWLHFTGAGKLALEDLRGAFANFLTDARTTFKGVGDALAAGDIQLAAKVLWASLRLVFEGGQIHILKRWNGFVLALKSAFDAVATGIQIVINDLFTFFTIGLARIADATRTFLSVLAEIDPTGIAKGLSGAINVDVDATIAGLEENRQKFREALENARAHRDTRRADKAQQRLAQLEDSLERLRAERQKVLDQADDARDRSDLFKSLEQARQTESQRPEVELPTADNSLAFGTFSAAAARLFGTGVDSTAQETLAETRRVAEATEATARSVKDLELKWS